MARPEASLRHGALLLLYTVSAFLLLTTLMGASRQVYQLVQPRPQAHGGMPQAHGGMLATSITAPPERGPAAGGGPSWQPALAALDTDESPLPVRLSLSYAARRSDCFPSGVTGASASGFAVKPQTCKAQRP